MLRSILVMAVGVFVWVATIAATAQPPSAEQPEGVRAAVKFLKSEERAILRVAHPTVTFRKAPVSGWEKDGKNYKLTLTYEFRDVFGDTHTTDLCFKCNDQGRVLGCEPGDSTTLLGPFFVTDQLVAAGKARLSGELEKSRSDPAKSAEYKLALAQLEKLVEDKNGKELLVMYLKLRQK